ncbi:hypothetical protein [Methylibium sp.]|uniref:hypothetical protein n=1 Tax=Methylibium sp. TaxID=2067992 RepID=UPI003BABF9F8
MTAATDAARRPGGALRASGLPEPIWLEWLALIGLLGFGTWLLGVRGVWGLLLSSDPTGLTLVIIIIFVAASMWAGRRARELQQQRAALHHAITSGRRDGDGWAAAYWAALAQRPTDADAPLDVLMEQTHGPHATAWWVNGIQLKLGLLGKVIGFSILAIQIGQTESFDAAQSQALLKSLTSGLGIALLTTMVGLVGNILLGLQLTRLDRYADALVSDTQRHGLAQGAAAREEAAAAAAAAEKRA